MPVQGCTLLFYLSKYDDFQERNRRDGVGFVYDILVQFQGLVNAGEKIQ